MSLAKARIEGSKGTKKEMASLKALKGRITSVKSTQKITKAMKMVAAAKLRRAQQAAGAGAPLCRDAWKASCEPSRHAW
jgi:hypothetical protein